MFPVKLVGKSTMVIFTGQPWHVLKSQYTGEGPEQGFGTFSQIDLTGLLVPFVEQTG